MGWEYHDRSVRQGAVVYCAFEGAHGYKKRVEALRRHYEIAEDTHVPLYIMPGQANLIKDHVRLIADLKAQLSEVVPAAVVLDTLNKSLIGSESKDLDMSAYLRAAEAIRDAFGCVVIIVHHCGLTKPGRAVTPRCPGRWMLRLRSSARGIVTVTVEHMRDGPEETFVTCVAKSVDVGVDANGKTLNSLVMVPGEVPMAGAGRWTKSLAVFRKALSEALLSSDLTVNINGPRSEPPTQKWCEARSTPSTSPRVRRMRSNGTTGGRHSTASWTRHRRKTSSEFECCPADRRFCGWQHPTQPTSNTTCNGSRRDQTVGNSLP